MELTSEVKLFTALMAILNPIGIVPVFLSILNEGTNKNPVRIAVTATVSVFVILAVMLIFGDSILSFFGITVNDFRISGGLLILLMALAMLHGQPSKIHHSKDEAAEANEKENPGFFPLAMPLLAGPGSMTTVIIYAHGVDKSTELYAGVLVILAACCSVFLVFCAAAKLSEFLGATGLNLMTRIMGMILAAIAVGMILDGITDAIPALQSSHS